MPGVRPLAAFTGDWIGGDIRGLQGIAERLYAYLPRVQDLAGSLSVTARDLTADGPGGWQGNAADAFTAAWGRQVRTAAALEDYVTGVALAIDALAVELSQIEHALEAEAHEASGHGVRIDTDGTVQGYRGAQSLQWALAYNRVLEQARSEADQARDAAARQLYDLYQQVLNPNPHLNGADATTGAGLLADLLAAPTASRREVSADIEKLRGKNLNLKAEIDQATKTGRLLPQTAFDASAKVETELQKVQDELARTGKTESALSRLLDTRASDVGAYLAGQAGSGRHVTGNTPKDLQAAAGDEPGALDRILKLGNDIPVVDVVTTAIGAGVGTYDDVQHGQPLGSALGDEAISNSAGTVAATGTSAMVGTELGARIGAFGGPVGIAAGAVVGYGVGDITHNVLAEHWGQDIHNHGVVHGVMDGVGHSMDQSADDTRQLGVSIGHQAEHVWDKLFG